jgi:hypothetical protein
MSNTTITRRLAVRGRRYYVTAQQMPNGDWVAKGSCSGAWIQVEAKSDIEAFNRWLEKAQTQRS